MALHLHDWQEALHDPRTRCFVGPTPAETLQQFATALRDSPAFSLPGQFIRCHLRPRGEGPGLLAGALAVEPIVKEVAAERLRTRDAAVAAANHHYQSKTREQWVRIFADAAGATPSRPLRILGITSRYTTVLKHAIAELQAAAIELGHEMRVAIEPDDASLENPFPEVVAEFQPDLIVQISRLRYENPHLPRNVPFVCWDQDNLPCMRTDAATASLDDLTFVAGHGALHGWSFLGWPRRNVIFCHPAASTHRYPLEAVPRELLAAHACDISFISNASAPPEEIASQQAARWKTVPLLESLFTACAQQILAQYQQGKTWEYSELQTLLAHAAQSQGVQAHERALGELALSLTLVADRCFRHAALHWAANFAEARGKTFRLYGNGWERHPRFGKFAAGSASQGPQVQAVYQASRINLQLIEGGFLHSRALDGLATGGFFLTRASPNDSRGDALSHALYVLGQRALDLKLDTLAALQASGDPPALEALATLGPCLSPYAPHVPLRALENWAALPQSPVVFPQLAKIRFTTEAQFAQLAETYLADEPARREIAAGMHAVVRERFTHTHRLRQFLRHVADALAQPR
jgi:hypothetical protein